MVYDAIMHENKALQEYTNEEVETDPLVFLNCGHVYPMSTLDGLLQLDSSYIRADSPDAPGGAWSAPRQLEASQAEQPLPSCILCRMPISDVPRYGRPLKRRALELAERKFVGICGNDLEAALADGVAIKQASHSLLLDGSESKREELSQFRTKYTTVLKRLKELVSFSRLSPSVRVRNATSARLQHLQSEGQPIDQETIEKKLQAVLLPADMTLSAQALLAIGRIMKLCMAVEARHVLSAIDKKAAWQGVEVLWQNARDALSSAVQSASKSQATVTEVSAKLVLAALMQQRARDLQLRLTYSMQSVFGSRTGDGAMVKKLQEALLRQSKSQSQAARANLAELPNQTSELTKDLDTEALRLDC